MGTLHSRAIRVTAVRLFGDFGDGKPIQDPYYGGKSGFETTYKQVLSYSEAFLDYIVKEHGQQSSQ